MTIVGLESVHDCFGTVRRPHRVIVDLSIDFVTLLEVLMIPGTVSKLIITMYVTYHMLPELAGSAQVAGRALYAMVSALSAKVTMPCT